MVSVGPSVAIERAAPARVQPWAVVALVFGIVTLIESFGASHIFAFLPLYLRLVGTPDGDVARWAGLLTAGISLLGLPLVPFWGAWADKYGRKPILIRSALVETVVPLLVALQLGNTGVMLAALRSAAPEQRVGLAIGLLGIASPIGMALGPAAGGWLAHHTALGLRGLFILDSALSACAALLLAVAYREVRTAARPTTPVTRLAKESLVGIATTPVSRLIFAIFALALLGQFTVQPFFPPFVARLHPGEASLAAAVGLVAGTASLLGVLCSPVAGFLGDRFGRARVLAAVTLAASLPALALGVALFGGCLSAIVALVYALLATLVPEGRRAATLNLAFVPFYCGAIAGPLLGAAVEGRGLAWVSAAAAALLFAALALQWRLRAA